MNFGLMDMMIISMSSNEICITAFVQIYLRIVSLPPENVTLYCKRMMRKNLEKKLQNVWGTEEIMDKSSPAHDGCIIIM